MNTSELNKIKEIYSKVRGDTLLNEGLSLSDRINNIVVNFQEILESLSDHIEEYFDIQEKLGYGYNVYQLQNLCEKVRRVEYVHDELAQMVQNSKESLARKAQNEVSPYSESIVKESKDNDEDDKNGDSDKDDKKPFPKKNDKKKDIEKDEDEIPEEISPERAKELRSFAKVKNKALRNAKKRDAEKRKSDKEERMKRVYSEESDKNEKSPPKKDDKKKEKSDVKVEVDGEEKPRKPEILKIKETTSALISKLVAEASKAKQTAGATKPEGLLDKESPKSKEFVAKHKVDVTDEGEEQKKSDSPTKGVTQAKSRNGTDNLTNGDKKVVNPVKEGSLIDLALKQLKRGKNEII